MRDEAFSWENVTCIFPFEIESLIYAAIIRRSHPGVEFIFCRGMETGKLVPEYWPANRRILLCNMSRNDPHFFDMRAFQEKCDAKSMRNSFGKFFRRVARAGHEIVGIFDSHRLRWLEILKTIRFKVGRLAVEPSYERHYDLEDNHAALFRREGGGISAGLSHLIGKPLDEISLTLFKKAALLEHGIRIKSFDRLDSLLSRTLLNALLRHCEEQLAEHKRRRIPAGRDDAFELDLDAIVDNLSRGYAPLAKRERRVLKRQTRREVNIAFEIFQLRTKRCDGIYEVPLDPGIAADVVERLLFCDLLEKFAERAAPDCRLFVLHVPERARELNGAIDAHAIVIERDRSLETRSALRAGRIRLDRSEDDTRIGINQKLTPKVWRILEDLVA